MSRNYPKELSPLIAHLKKLPGVGLRTAERFAFDLIGWPQDDLTSLGTALQLIREKIPPCKTCGCLTEEGSCKFCLDKTRDQTQLCITASAKDVFAIEATGSFKGLYHVVEHLLSPLDGRHASDINFDRIQKRVFENKSAEIILAFDSSLEGDTTALFLKNQLLEATSGASQITISRPAFGLPLGSSLEYVDGGTLSRSFKGRQTF